MYIVHMFAMHAKGIRRTHSLTGAVNKVIEGHFRHMFSIINISDWYINIYICTYMHARCPLILACKHSTHLHNNY